jgi:antitoxin (DNA-binding transcriptional repressor) of toxin-antitoxin stability system
MTVGAKFVASQFVAAGDPDAVYNVHTMKDLKVAEARARFGELLDEAAKGRPVSIERRGVRFQLIAQSAGAPKRSKVTPLFEFVDASVAAGQWSWKPGRKGLAFAPRRKRR